jgi:hypothetical protein
MWGLVSLLTRLLSYQEDSIPKLISCNTMPESIHKYHFPEDQVEIQAAAFRNLIQSPPNRSNFSTVERRWPLIGIV